MHLLLQKSSIAKLEQSGNLELLFCSHHGQLKSMKWVDVSLDLIMC